MRQQKFKTSKVSLGYQPLANNLIKKSNDKCELYPLEVNYCEICHNCQLSVSMIQKNVYKLFTYFFDLKVFQKPLY